MLDWLKKILGDSYTDDIDKQVSDEIGKGFVARSDFNDLNKAKKTAEDTIKDRDTQLENLKNSTGDLEALKQKITDLQTENSTKDAEHKAELKRLKVDSAIETALIAAKAKNTKAVKALLDLDKISLDGENVIGLSDQIKTLIDAEESKFMFETADPKAQQGFKGLKPGEAGGDPPNPKQPSTLQEAVQAAMAKSNE